MRTTLVASVANTHLLKVEKLEGTLDIDLQGEESTIRVDEMHFTQRALQHSG